MRRQARAALLASVTRHLELMQTSERLDTEALGLTGRDREVCERLLKGRTCARMAADLHVSAATVTTCRDRTFARLTFPRLNPQHRNAHFVLASAQLERKSS